ncbi:MAG: methyltransferase domain-containing protein [Chitinivibrionales bacterium]|nr:methyltransferase domain-containing protein [Chitinivibrionales bacterium]
MSTAAESAVMRWSKKDIVDYYVTNETAYRLWGPNMHYGYWVPGVKTQRQASLRFNEEVALTAGISRDDHVLDAGCGVGGCSIYLARTFGCRVTGITITPRQVGLAKRNAEKAGVAHLTEFHEMDYEHTTFDDGRFSVVWGLESVCYAEDKRRFVAEASRLLRDGGRLVVADGFASREHYEGADAKLMQRWLDGWIVNSLNTPGQWRQFAADAGFRSSDYRDVTPFVRKTSRLMLYVSLPFLPLHLLDKVVRMKSYPTDALFNQYFAMKKGLWEYGIFLATK